MSDNTAATTPTTQIPEQNAKPKPNAFTPPPPPMLDNPLQPVMDSCIFKSAMATVMGGVMGVAFGALFANANLTTEDVNKPLRTQIWEGAKAAKRSGVSMGKNFALVGGIYSGTECFIEYARGRTDMYNGISAGCLTGAALAGRGGPQAMAIGCGGFAAFSVAIDYFTGRHDPETHAHHDPRAGVYNEK